MVDYDTFTDGLIDGDGTNSGWFNECYEEVINKKVSDFNNDTTTLGGVSWNTDDTLVIAADTVNTGVLIIAVWHHAFTNAYDTSTDIGYARILTGETGSETEKTSRTAVVRIAGSSDGVTGSTTETVMYWETTLTWTNSNNVILESKGTGMTLSSAVAISF